MATKRKTEEDPRPGSADAWAANIAARWRYERSEAPAYVPEEETGGDEEDAG